jgi:hypothetical protein
VLSRSSISFLILDLLHDVALEDMVLQWIPDGGCTATDSPSCVVPFTVAALVSLVDILFEASPKPPVSSYSTFDLIN